MGKNPKKLVLIQPRDHAVKAILPKDTNAGVYAIEITSGNSSKHVLINKPNVWWARGDTNLDAYPGGKLRVFGLGLGGKVLAKILRELLQATPPQR